MDWHAKLQQGIRRRPAVEIVELDDDERPLDQAPPQLATQNTIPTRTQNTDLTLDPRVGNTIPESQSHLEGFVGLKNPDHLCYMNSVVQALYHLPVFRRLVLSAARPNHVLLQLQTVFKDLGSPKLGCAFPLERILTLLQPPRIWQ
jgi:hypothetical protein